MNMDRDDLISCLAAVCKHAIQQAALLSYKFPRHLMCRLILGQPQPPPHVPPHHLAVDCGLDSLILPVRVERLAQHAGVEEAV